MLALIGLRLIASLKFLGGLDRSQLAASQLGPFQGQGQGHVPGVTMSRTEQRVIWKVAS